MNFKKLYRNLKNELNVFPNESSVNAWLVANRYNITVLNYRDIADKGNHYIASTLEDKVKNILNEIELYRFSALSVNTIYLKNNDNVDVFKKTGIGAGIGLGAALLLGAAALPFVAIGAFFGALWGGTNKFRDEVTSTLIENSKRYAEEYYKKLEPIIWELANNVIDGNVNENVHREDSLIVDAEYYTDEQLQIKSFLESRNIKYLVHFTDISNADSIKKYGLLSNDELIKRGIPFKRNDENRFDGNTDYISLSITNMNKLVYSSYKNTGRIGNTCLVFIDAKVLYEEINVKRIYCDKNASATACNKGSNFKDLENMFVDSMSYSTTSNYYIYNRIDDYRNLNETTDPQAEIQFNKSIDKKYIVKIEKLGE